MIGLDYIVEALIMSMLLCIVLWIIVGRPWLKRNKKLKELRKEYIKNIDQIKRIKGEINVLIFFMVLSIVGALLTFTVPERDRIWTLYDLMFF